MGVCCWVYFGVMCRVLLSWIILLLRWLLMMMCVVSVVNLLGWFRCLGKGIELVRLVFILVGSLFSSGVVKSFGVMV